MTRAVYLCLFYDHSLCLGRGARVGVARSAGVVAPSVPAGQWTPACAGMTGGMWLESYFMNIVQQWARVILKTLFLPAQE